MREIGFKAERSDNGEWAKGCLIIDYVTGQYFIHQCGNSTNESQNIGEEGCLQFTAFEIDSDTLCQYTGLTDKKGDNIWENDICIIKNGGLDEEDGYFVCKWDDETARYILDGDGLFVDFDNVDTLDVEVIGNIFDNADLLNWMVIE